MLRVDSCIQSVSRRLWHNISSSKVSNYSVTNEISFWCCVRVSSIPYVQQHRHIILPNRTTISVCSLYSHYVRRYPTSKPNYNEKGDETWGLLRGGSADESLCTTKYDECSESGLQAVARWSHAATFQTFIRVWLSKFYLRWKWA